MPTGVVHIDRALTNISLSASADQNLIAERVLLPCPVDDPSDKLYKYGEEIFLTEEDARAPGAQPNETTWKVTSVSYATKGHALEHGVPRDKKNAADPALSLLADTTRILTAKGRLNMEVNCVAALVAAMTGASAVDCAAAKWSSADVNPLYVLKAYIDTITLACGQPPNVLMLSQPVATAVRTNPQVVGLITGAAALAGSKVSMAQIADWLELDEVLVGRAVSKTTPGGTKAFVWGTKAMLFYRPPAPGLLTLALGYTMKWQKALAAVTGLEAIPGMEGVGPQFVQQYWWEPTLSDVVVVHNYYDQAVYAAECGILFNNCI